MFMQGEGSEMSHKDKQIKRSLAKDSVNNDNDVDHNHNINSRKRKSIDGRLDTLTEIDLSVRLEKDNVGGGESELMKKNKPSNLVDISEQVKMIVEEEEPMEPYEGVHYCEERSSRIFTSVRDSEIVQKSKLGSLHVEMSLMKEENKKLKSTLSNIMKNYQNLHMHVLRVMQQAHHEENNAHPEETPKESINCEEETKLVSLSLGINSSLTKTTKEETASGKDGKEDVQFSGQRTRGSQDHLKGFTFSLDVTDEYTSKENNEGKLSSESSMVKSEGGLIKSKTLDISVEGPESSCRGQSSKAINISRDACENSEVATRIRKARVSVRARCKAPTMIDGCHWRKYGQKKAKGNLYPRAYYRCTVVPGCPVRKQVQRCPDDMEMLITTYKESHNHKLSLAGTAMASTTEAAVSMLLSGSTSSPEAMNANNPYMSLLDQCFASNHTIVTSTSFPTITLDLTNNPNAQLNPRNSVPAGGSSSASMGSTIPLSFRHPASGYNFLSTLRRPNTKIRSQHSFPTVPSSNPWNHNHVYYAKLPHQQAYKTKPNSSIPTRNHDFDSQLHYQTSLNSFLNNPIAIQRVFSKDSLQTLIQNVIAETFVRSTVTTSRTSSAQHSLAETVSAATAAVTSHPNFSTALVNAVASIISSQGIHSKGEAIEAANNIVPNYDQRKWGEPITDSPDPRVTQI